MKTLLVSTDGTVVFNEDEKKLEHIYSTPDRISRMYIAKEPMEVLYNDDGVEVRKPVEKDDIVILFYNTTTYKYPVVVAKCPEWAENVRLYNEREQEEKIKWAEAQSNVANTPCENIG